MRDREHHLEYHKQWRLNNRIKILELAGGLSCKHCGFKEIE